jgi:Xaa-Pro aminopeptidase
LGLDIHEPPRFGSTRFKAGQVITVEPGIYWPGVGGCRIEDVALLTRGGVRKISRFPQEIEI